MRNQRFTVGTSNFSGSAMGERNFLYIARCTVRKSWLPYKIRSFISEETPNPLLHPVLRESTDCAALFGRERRTTLRQMKVLPTHPPVKQESGREAWLLLLALRRGKHLITGIYPHAN